MSALSTMDAALEYAKRGWPVLPVHTVTEGGCSCGRVECAWPGKHPWTPNGVKDATTDEATIRHWWAERPSANVGIATGTGRGPAVIDVDPRNGGTESLAELGRQFGPLPETICVETGDGLHFYFASPASGALRGRVIAPGVELKGDGQYVVAPPSAHRSGRQYRMRRGLESIAMAPLPVWIHPSPGAQRSAVPGGATSIEPPLSRRIAGGERNTELTRVAGSLRRAGGDDETILAALLAVNARRCDPPLEDHEIRRIARGMMRYPPGASVAETRPPTENGNLLREGSSLLVEVRTGRGARDVVTVHRRNQEQALLVDTVNLISERARKDVVSRLPEDVRAEAGPLLESLALDLTGRTNGSKPREAQGQAITFQDPDPWPEEVDGDRLLDDLYGTYSRFLALPDGAAESLALWTLHAHTYDAGDVSPILALLSPERRCGKTRALQLMDALVPRPLLASNVSPAALFRTVEKFRPTLLVDEADTFLRMNEELRGILNGGHTRRGAVVIRTVGDDHEPRAFHTWAPKAIALIGALPPTLEDRSIAISMRRRMATERIESLRIDRLVELESLRRQASRWARDNMESLRAADPGIPPGLNDRAADNLRPLLAIADLAGGRWPERARQVALLVSGQGEEGETIRVQLLADIRRVFKGKATDKMSSRDLVFGLIALEGRPWGEWRAGRPMTQVSLARMLRPFSIHPHMLRVGQETGRGYCVEDLEDAFSRYVPPDPKQAQQSDEDAPRPLAANRNIAQIVAPERRPETPRGDSFVADVTSGEPQQDDVSRPAEAT